MNEKKRPLPLNELIHQKNDLIITDLVEKGWSLCPQYAVPLLCESILSELQNQSFFLPAGIGQGSQKQIQSAIRNDFTYWPRPEILTPNQISLFDSFQLLREEINRELFLGLEEFEAHFTKYPPGSFYKKHLDQFKNNRQRKISCILYLNPHWSEEDGGLLRLYSRENPEKIEQDIVPRAGTLVCFLSDCIYHEVLPTKRERYAFTGWLRKNEGARGPR